MGSAMSSTTSGAVPAGLSPEEEQPIRAELFSVERLEQHAETLAAAQTVEADLTRGRPLTPRVLENGRVLLESYRALAQAIQQEHTITPAAEWLVDNFHIVDEQLREIREDLPPGFYRKLPKLSSGHLQGYPRVFGVAWAFVAHTDSRFDPEVLRRFVSAYQRVQPLTIGELWAVAITLRIVLVENLRRIAERIVRSRAARQEADTLADSLLGIGGLPALPPADLLKKFEGRPLSPAFAVQLLQRLHDVNPNVRVVLAWLDERLAGQNTTADDIVRHEHQRQAAMNVTVRNIITSMRLMSAFEWRDFFESVSLVDEVLGSETNFAELDFATRDSYRHAVEGLSRGCRHSEVEIAQRVVQHVKRARIDVQSHSLTSQEPLADPGYYLISLGRFEFEREIGYRLSWRRRALRSYMQTALPGYLGTIALITAAFMALPLLHESEAGVSGRVLFFFGLLALFPASDLAIALINRVVTDWLGPRSLPRLDLRKGIPEHLRTIVVMPVLLTRPQEVAELVLRLEIHYLSNSEGNLHFALLSDWVDAPTETLPADEELLAAATRGIAELNARYGPAPGGGERFLLFHRRRVWNEEERKWMGWERKRGKLQELNQFLRGATNTTFVGASERAPDWLLATRYVITLDADTRLPPGVTYRLVGTMAHPLNRPVFSPAAGRVVEGYGLMQPRTMPTLPTGHGGSLFQKIFSGPAGMDAYATAVSDVYHDLFREGSFTGKGIYEIDAFQASLAGKVPENTMLSHDLFEGIFARTAMVTDIELFEEFPVHYETAAARAHRWVRGDWQLLPWVFGRGPGRAAKRNPVKVPAVGRWKMLDNLRRSLSAPASFLLLVAGWLLPPASPWVWTRFLIFTTSIPPLLPFLIGLDPRFAGVSKRTHLRSLMNDLVLGLSQTGLALTFLAYQAWLMLDAITRTLARLYITHKNMLEWVTAAQAKYAVDFNLVNMYRRMAGGLAFAAVAAAVLAMGRHAGLEAATPFLFAWALAPAMAQWISVAPELKETAPLSPSEEQVIRLTARKTWRFFSTFVTSADHALPPDNFQEDPKPVVAHRTSPTNIGLYLLATLAARDLGSIGTLETVERLEETLETMSHLELFRGHFYNWYDTSNLRPLEPRYISSVDSGNLAGHLLALSNGCRELLDKPFAGNQLLSGLQDCIGILRESLAGVTETRRANIVNRKQLSNAVDALAASLHPLPGSSAALAARLADLRTQTHTVADIAQAFAQERSDVAESEWRAWASASRDCLESHWRDAQILVPWTRLDAKEIASMSRETGDWSSVEPFLRAIPKISAAPAYFACVLADLATLREGIVRDSPSHLAALGHIDRLGDAIRKSAADAEALIGRLNRLAQTAESMFYAMDFTFLFDPIRKLFSIGYRVSDGTIDAACYDLLASEARLTSYIAIAKGDVESSHWFRLGRTLTPVDRGSALISWSGSMFEYLMPALVMRAPEDSVLSETARLVVRRQIEYGAERDVPWGVSESAFNARDIDLRYQYSAFGVPGLGLKRGLSEDVVIAPYATALAAMIDPFAATQNIARLMEAGAKGQYGLYEALDYTAERVPEGQKVAVIQAYFAHHQGMTLLALANVLTDGATCARFHAEPIVKAVELLLQEKTPRDVLVARPRAEEVKAARVRELVPPALRRFSTPHDPSPRTQLLSNGRYAVMLTSAGSGYSRWRDIAVTRWREDATRDCWGSYIYLRDPQTNQVWSAGYQPSGLEPETYEAAFFEDRAEIHRRDRTLHTSLEVVVSSDDDAELRRVSITNQGLRSREIQVTSYAEICLTSQAADVAHPAFSNLFVETEFDAASGALLATRRRRSDKETPVWLAHVTAVEGETVGNLEYETSRPQFIGRGRETRNPIGIFDGTPLGKTTGPVLDPIVSIRRTIRIPPGTTARVIFSTILASTREQALELADKHRDATTFERTLTLAWTQAQVQLRHLGIDPDEANLFQRLANAIVYADAALRPSSDALSRESLDLGALWAQGISGDRPIVLAFIDEADDIEIIRQLLRAHEYWRMKNLAADLVIINEKAHSYAQGLHGALETLVRGSQFRVSPERGDALGNIFLLKADLISPQLRALLQAVARALIFSRRGTLSEQVNRSQRSLLPVLPEAPRPAPPRDKTPDVAPAALDDLAFANGLGGFDENGREYVVVLGEGVRTPQPWINVIANPAFGFIVSESGSGYTWSLNSHENQLTPWFNDPVSDPPGEAIYIRDNATGEIWSPTALPVREEVATYICRHGQGYTRFQHSSHGIQHELTQFVPLKDPIKISRLTLRNTSNRTLHLSIAAYAEWVLGSSRSASAPFLVTEADAKTGALFARSAWQGEFGGRIAFADLAGKQASFTCDRKEFIGRNGTLEYPAALAQGARLSGKAGAGFDPCAALLTSLELRPGARAEVVFFLGQAENREQAQEIIGRFRAANLDGILSAVVASWDEVLGAVQVTTPEPAMDLMLNRWLLYQTLACRVWGRAAFYQASGAYGFRDQLQDVLALCVAKRDVAREHLLRAASRQFLEGDVQHWWHPPSGRGVRTRISDDLLWLPYAVSRFTCITGDTAVLDEAVPFIEGEVLAEGQNVSYFQPRISETKASLFEHCARAIDRSLGVGAHGLPLMGTGDWNDGMDRVGEHGKGESVWLGWFLHLVLSEFALIADSRGERARAETWRLHVTALKAALEREAWDGEWYRRAYFDDGTPLGSAQDEECKIDSIAQSWGVISGAAEPGRAQRAMAAVEQHLVRKRDALILLLAPPFAHSAVDPGYIKGYLPGIRENGGQYTHASTWVVLAFAALGDGDRAGELFRMLNPVNHARSRADVLRYKVEPYVVAGDVYSEPPHVARGGWTWYSGSAGWLYRVGLEAILGFRLQGMALSIDPCVPRNWANFSITFRYHSATYKIKVENPSSVTKGIALTRVDGNLFPGKATIGLVDDGEEHEILVVMG
jgi:cyclic beta-1,2-glucan synthetase